MCLDSLLPQASNLGVSVDVIENGSTDETLKDLLKYQKLNPVFNVQNLGYNYGFAGGFNAGISDSDSDWLLLINSDIRFPNNSLSNFLRVVQEAEAEIGIVAPLTNNAGNGQSLMAGITSFEQVEVVSKQLISKPSRFLSSLYRADFCCVSIRNSVWKQLGGLDSRYGRGYFEDIDFSLRAKRLGYRIVCCEDCVVFHEGGSSFKDEGAQKELIKANKKIFMSRFPDAQLENRREEVLRIMLQYSSFLNHANKQALALRFNLRETLLLGTLPKSPIKRLWFLHRMRWIAKDFSKKLSEIS